MLRARPIHSTSRPEQWEKLLTALGLVKTENRGGWEEYDAGSGRLALRLVAPGSPEDGTTEFSVEVGDPEEFARRTNEAAGDDSTRAELSGDPGTDGGTSCRVTGHGGFAFQAEKAAHLAGCADADPALAVVAVWFTDNSTAAAETLQRIGARYRPSPDDYDLADFTTKNGGILMVRVGQGPAHSGLGFEYTGDLEALRDRLSTAGLEASITEEAFSRSLHVPSPDAGSPGSNQPRLWVAGRQPAES